MTIECYYSACEYHCSHDPNDEGPFCYERECRATDEQIVVFQRQREEEMKSWTQNQS